MFIISSNQFNLAVDIGIGCTFHECGAAHLDAKRNENDMNKNQFQMFFFSSQL